MEGLRARLRGSRSAPGERGGGAESCTPAAPSKGGNRRSLNMKWISAPVKAFEVVFEFQEKKKPLPQAPTLHHIFPENQRRPGQILIKHVEETRSLLTVSVIITHSWSPHQTIDARTLYRGTFGQTGSWCFKQWDYSGINQDSVIGPQHLLIGNAEKVWFRRAQRRFWAAWDWQVLRSEDGMLSSGATGSWAGKQISYQRRVTNGRTEIKSGVSEWQRDEEGWRAGDVCWASCAVTAR